MKQGVIIGFLGKTQDRFSEYQLPVSVKEKLEIVKEIEGFDGVEIVFPYETGDPVETKGWVEELELHFAAVNVNIKKEPEWVPGALSTSTSPPPTRKFPRAPRWRSARLGSMREY